MMSDPDWYGGSYYSTGRFPHRGLKLARLVCIDREWMAAEACTRVRVCVQCSSYRACVCVCVRVCVAEYPLCARGLFALTNARAHTHTDLANRIPQRSGVGAAIRVCAAPHRLVNEIVAAMRSFQL